MVEFDLIKFEHKTEWKRDLHNTVVSLVYVCLLFYVRCDIWGDDHKLQLLRLSQRAAAGGCFRVRLSHAPGDTMEPSGGERVAWACCGQCYFVKERNGLCEIERSSIGR